MKSENKEIEELKMINIWGNPMKIEQILNEQESAHWYCYKLVLFFPSDFPPKYYNLKMALHDDISIAREIGFQLFKTELDWQQMQPVHPPDDKMGIALIFQPMGGGESLVVESNIEELAELTEKKREEEKTVFQELGKEYPERNFTD